MNPRRNAKIMGIAAQFKSTVLEIWNCQRGKEGIHMQNKIKKLGKSIRKNIGLYVMLAIPLAWYIIFKYIPMYGLQIAFRRFNPTLGITQSPWVGLTYFKQFFDSYYFWDILWNTVSLSLFTMLVGFPMPIVLALIINEIKNLKFIQEKIRTPRPVRSGGVFRVFLYTYHAIRCTNYNFYEYFVMKQCII